NVRREAAGLWKVWKGESSGAGSLPSVFVLEPDDVIDLRGGHFEELTLLHSDHPMLAPRNDPARHAGGESVRLQLAPVVLQLQVHGPLDDQQRLVLLPVILKAEHLPRVDVDHLAEVLVGDREAVFPAPGLLDNVRQVGAARASLRARRAADRRAPSRTLRCRRGSAVRSPKSGPHPTSLPEGILEAVNGAGTGYSRPGEPRGRPPLDAAGD